LLKGTQEQIFREEAGNGGVKRGAEVCLYPLLCSMWQKRVATPLKKK